MGELRAAVFDWAGTVIDHGSLAPMGVFVKTFAEFGVAITIAEARGPMGMAKRDHIRALLAQPRVAAAWEKAQGAAPDEAAIDRVYAVFVPMNEAAVADYCTMIEGAVPAIERLRARGLKIGSTTGYTRSIMARVLPLAEAQGYRPDNLVCAGDLAEGRPSALMMYRTFLDLGVWPAWRVVKVDDTGVGIAEGLNAGCWTVGVALSGNAFGLTPAETAALSPAEFAARREAAHGELLRAGAHFVIDSVAGIDAVIDAIEGRLARGERP
ncbi:MAG: phosphonoacetaldehyde hydrolase [Rhodobacteraceae bacterium]|nr:phosphonoacetaldehyde hydrolase [Paracoccaceae bacterium]